MVALWTALIACQAGTCAREMGCVDAGTRPQVFKQMLPGGSALRPERTMVKYNEGKKGCQELQQEKSNEVVKML